MGKVVDPRLSILNAAMQGNVNQSQDYGDYMRGVYQDKINSEFQYATDVYNIGEELVIGTMNFTSVETRITHIVRNNVGKKLGDDFKEIIFRDMEHTKGMGIRYHFDNNYWITINTDYYHYPTSSTVIRRCNNSLNWVMPNGQVHSDVCIIDYDLKSNDFDMNTNIIIAEGDIIVTVQLNEYTKTIAIDDRFIFNGQAFRCRAINSFLRNFTFDNNSVPLIYLYLNKDNVNADDDITNNVANVNRYVYTLTIEEEPFEQTIGHIGNLTATVKLNNEIMDIPVTWISSDANLATIDNAGQYTLIDNGIVTFTCRLTNNPTIHDDINITITPSPNIETQILVTPDQSNILQSKTVEYEVYKYRNDVTMTDTFTMTFSGVPEEHYGYVILSGNSFKITNRKIYTNGLLKVRCTSNVDSTFVDFYIELKGVW